MKIVLTVFGEDKVGIIAGFSNLLAKSDVNILNINQNIVEGFFNMVLVADMSGSTLSFAELKAKAVALGAEIGVEVRFQNEAIFSAMHRI